MIDTILSQSVGNYIAIWKLVLYALFFGLWCWVGQWQDKDTLFVRTNRTFWNNLYLGCGVVTLFLWLILPTVFWVGFLLFFVAWLTLEITYVLHRNARVKEVERIFTPDHIKTLFSKDKRQKETKQRLSFISAHNNELPVPYRQDPEYDGYVYAEDLLYQLCLQRVSLCELIPVNETVKIRKVIDGVVSGDEDRNTAEVEPVIAYLKAVANLDTKDRRRPQSGSFAVRMNNTLIKWYINTSGSTRGEQLILEKQEDTKTLKMDAIGFNPDQLEQVRQIVKEPSGVIVVSGGKGSGLTTTLYSLTISHDAYIQNVNSLEKKFLADIDNITQNLLETDTKRTAARQLQTVLRRDPDVIMVGFSDEGEMAKLCTQAARDGKKVYFALNASSTFHALQEWIKMVGNSDKVAETLLGITYQKLLRKLCKSCREAYIPDPNLLKKLNLPVDKIKQFYRPPKEIEYDKKGRPIVCETCQGTGYIGRTAVLETLVMTDALRQLIRENAPISALRTQCRKDRMLYLQEQALRRVIDGTTSIQEVLRITSEDSPEKKKVLAGETPPADK